MNETSYVTGQLTSHRALDVVGRLAKKGGQKEASAWATLNKLMDSNLSAKYWVTGRLAPTDILTECEFFDAGLVSVLPLSPFFLLFPLLSYSLSHFLRHRAQALPSHPSPPSSPVLSP